MHSIVLEHLSAVTASYHFSKGVAITNRFLKTKESKFHIPFQEGQEGRYGEIRATQPCTEKLRNKFSWKPFRTVRLAVPGAKELPLTQAHHRSVTLSVP